MFSKMYTYHRISDCTDQVRRVAKQNFKMIPEDDVVFYLERLSPRTEHEKMSEIADDAILAAQDALESVEGQGKRASIIADYNYHDIPELSRIFMRHEGLLAANPDIGRKFFTICLYADQQQDIMTKTLMAIVNMFSSNAKFAHSFDEALKVTADTLSMQ